MAAPSGISQPKLNRNRIVFFFFFGFVYANSSFPTTFLPEWSPLPPPQSLPPPSLLCMTLLSLDAEWMKTLSRELGIQQQALRNVSLMGTKEGVRHQREESWAREDHCAHNYSGGWEHAAPPHMPYPSSVHTQEHTQTHAHPSSSGERRLRLRR